MDSEFSVGDSVEAVDSVGCWARSIVREIREDGCFLVSFDDWSRSWDRRVASDEIRPVTVMEEAQKRPRGRNVRKVKLQDFHLEREDVCHYRCDNELKTGVIQRLDPFRQEVRIADGDDVVDVPASALVFSPGEDVEEPPKKSQKKTGENRPTKQDRSGTEKPEQSGVATNKVSKSRKRPSASPTGSIPPAREDPQAESGDGLHLPAAVGANAFVSPGDICMYEGTLLIMIVSLCMVEGFVQANSSICNITANMATGVKGYTMLQSPSTDLHKTIIATNHHMLKLAREAVSRGMANLHTSLRQNASRAPYQLMVRRVSILRQIASDIAKTLGGKALRRSIEYVLAAGDYDLFCLNEQNKYTTLYFLEDGYQFLDSLFFPKWDVKWDASDPTSKFFFVRSLGIKCNMHHLVITIIKCESSSTYTTSYRSQAVRDLESIQREFVQPSVDTAASVGQGSSEGTTSTTPMN